MTNNTNNQQLKGTAPNPNIIEILDDYYPDSTPVVRYAHPRDDGVPKQEPVLRGIHDPIPEDAIWASGIYFLTDQQLSRLKENEDEPYSNLYSSDNIAKTLQDECEDDGRVLYTVHAESDEHEDKDEEGDPVPLPTMIEWLEGFVREVIEMNPDDCTFYYSGNRSIHVHAPLFARGENLDWLKKQTKRYQEDTEMVLDATVYKRKQQFRLPGAINETVGAFRKIKIGSDWGLDQIVRAAQNDVDQPETYADVLKTIFNPQDATELQDLLVSGTVENQGSSAGLATWQNRYSRYDDDQRSAHRAKEFYPHRTGEEHDGRSVASLRVEGEPFQRQAGNRSRTFVPCYFYGAHACNGRAFTKYNEYAPLQLVEKDVKKWDHEEGDTVVVIGGGSYESIIRTVPETTAERVGELLDPEDGTREDALAYLEDEGYDVGSAGPSQAYNDSGERQKQRRDEDEPTSKTDAARFKQRAEQDDVEISLSHGERLKVANRLLTIDGWDRAWNWFRDQYGSDFDPEITRRQFRSILKTHSDDEDLRKVEVPTPE